MRVHRGALTLALCILGSIDIGDEVTIAGHAPNLTGALPLTFPIQLDSMQFASSVRLQVRDHYIRIIELDLMLLTDCRLSDCSYRLLGFPCGRLPGLR